ncbi:MAG TPA: tetratricopeptide repeat protein [Candidatus Acidoferrales bacterium]|nr:tetratricopeptide repeat protein [Candidatus Acidoferrales bacterium]
MRLPAIIALAPALALSLACPASADTILLKNGRRIVALSVSEQNGQVTYQTPAGEMSIPREIVARIEHDDVSYSSTSSSGVAASDPPPVSAPDLAPPPGYDEIARLAIHGDAVDFGYMASLDSAARGANSPGAADAAAAHFAAGKFFAGKGQTDQAMDQYRQAISFQPENAGLLLTLAVLDLRSSQFTAALDPLERAQRIAPNSAAVSKMMGWAYYGANNLDRAIEEWERSEKLHPDPEVETALAKAKRDAAEEEGYRENETLHFTLKYYGGAAPDLARGILRALESDFNDLSSQLDYTPSEQIAVILYTNQGFADITRAPAWVGALNDGRIRIPVQGLTDVTPDLARVLRHELTHSFIGQKSRGRAPVWLQEGLAQWMEGARSAAGAATLLDAAKQNKEPQLASLEGSWMAFAPDAATLDYEWSLATVESIIANGGIGDVNRLIEAIATAPSAEDALRAALRCSYAGLQQQTIDYLHRESGQ